MTPQSHPHTFRVPVRRSAALLAAVLVIVGTPLVARALGDEAPDDLIQSSSPAAEGDTGPSPDLDIGLDASIDADPLTAESLALPEIEASGVALPKAIAEPDVDPVIVLLADTYSWGEQGPRVATLQETVGVVADGVYAHATQRAHRNALEFVGLPTDTLPAVVLPPGPSAAEWEALRQCESNGNYAITNPSGKYRGAYQFDRSTWNSVAERHAPHLAGADPAAALPADQDYMALALYSERGARPWPHCGRHLS